MLRGSSGKFSNLSAKNWNGSKIIFVLKNVAFYLIENGAKTLFFLSEDAEEGPV